MGAVSIDIHKAEREFHNLNFSDANVIKWLIVYRDKVDIYYGAETDNYFNNAGHVKNVNQELIHIYAYLDELIKECRFNQGQLNLIHLVSVGHTFKDIEELHGDTTAQNVKRRFQTICKIISEMNNQEWSLWISNAILKDEKKECSRCKKVLPAKEKFFGKDGRKSNGFKTYCKKCDKNTKRT